MAIHPIDLQTMYSNMGNVARNYSAQQLASQSSKQFQDNTTIQQNLEKATQVNKAAENETKSTALNADGRGGSENPQHKGEKKESQQEEVAPKVIEIRKAHLGNHIDIST